MNQRQGMTFAEVYAEYQAAHAQVRDLAAQIPADLWQQSGALAWYGAAYDLEAFIVSTLPLIHISRCRRAIHGRTGGSSQH